MAVLLVACGNGGSSVDDGGAGRPDASAPDAGPDGAVDGGVERVGMAGRSGTATVGADVYDGTEELFFLADEGNGDAVCRIGYALTSTGTPVQGCDGCSWAFELVVDSAEVLEQSDVGCLPTLGIDPGRVDELNGLVVAYGYNPAYVGHGSVLMSRTDEGSWAPEGFASWDDATGAFSYRRVDGFPSY